MPVSEELSQVKPVSDTLLSIGVFDGVHLGHQKLIGQLKELASKRGLISGIISFKEHPERVFGSTTDLLYLTDPAIKKQLLINKGVNLVTALTFNNATAALSARTFVNLLQEKLKMKGLVIGFDFALGKHREGNSATLSRLGKEMGFSVTVVPAAVMDGEVVSSTVIRKALASGMITRANRLMGHPFALQKKVISGAGRGKKLGFPTANLDIEAKQALPPNGVYACLAYIDNNEAYRAMTYIGNTPTFTNKERTVEVFILDYQGNLYGNPLKVEFIDQIRKERKFATAAELQVQIGLDIAKGKLILDTYCDNHSD